MDTSRGNHIPFKRVLIEETKVRSSKFVIECSFVDVEGRRGV